MSSATASASAVEKTLEQQIDQLVAQFKTDLLAQVHLLFSNQVESKEVKEKEKLTNHVIDSDGTKRWYNAQGQLHRDELDEHGNVLPARELISGHKEWYINGQLHREGDKPAIICSNGDQEWWTNYQLHRADDKPAIERSNGDQEWWINGKHHREGDKPAIERSNGEKEWWIKGKCIKKLLLSSCSKQHN